MTINEYIEISRRYKRDFDCIPGTNTSLKEYGKIFCKELFNIDLQIEVIDSTSSRNETVSIDGQNYIIWDTSYWKGYNKFLCILFEMDIAGADVKNAQELLMGLFGDFIINKHKYINSDFALFFLRNVMAMRFYETSYALDNTFVQDVLRVCKFYVLTHEAFHLVLEKNEISNFRKTKEWICSKLKDYIKTDVLKMRRNDYGNIFKENPDMLVTDLLGGKYENLFNEIVIDLQALYEILGIIRLQSKLDANGLVQLAPHILRYILTLSRYDMALSGFSQIAHNASMLLKGVYSISNVNEKQSLFNKECFLRDDLFEVTATKMFLDYCFVVKSSFTTETIMEMFTADDIHPQNKSYHEYVRTFFNNNGKRIILSALSQTNKISKNVNSKLDIINYLTS